MRGAYTNGVLAALEDRGFRTVDAVYGTSAGGAMAAWWSAGQARYALGTWKYAGDPRILSMRRWLTLRGPLLDHDTLFHVVYVNEHPLNLDAVQRARHPVIVTATDADSAQTVYVDLRDGQVLDWLRATGRLPLAAGVPVVIGGRRYLDGGMSDPIPMAKAIADGATEILCILNNPPGPRKAEPGLTLRIIAKKYPRMADLARRHHELHDQAVRLAEHPPAGVAVHVVRPVQALRVGRLTSNLRRVQAAIELGEADGYAFADAHPAWLTNTTKPNLSRRPR